MPSAARSSATSILTVASIAESITVSGQSPVVDPRQTGIVKSLSAEVVEAVPQNRQGGIMAYMATLPGVTPANYNRVGGVNVMGSNANETSYVVDGITLNHVMSGGSYGYFDQDNIEEMNVVSLGASAEYQQAQGGVMNVVTKAGANRWRGDGVWYWAPPALTSAPVTLPCNCPEGQTGFKLYRYPGLRCSCRWTNQERSAVVLRRRERCRPELSQSGAAGPTRRIQVAPV